MALKTIIWGCGKEYEKHKNLIHYQELLGNISVLGITAKDNIYINVDEYPFILKEQLIVKNMECLIVATGETFQEIVREAIVLGVDEDTIIQSDLLELPNFDIKIYLKLKKEKLSIISYNCWAGITYNYLRMPFLSPLINISVKEEDFLELMSNFQHYMKIQPKFSKWGINDITNVPFPYLKLGDINLACVHDTNVEEVMEKWNHRLSRINYENMLVMMCTSEEMILNRFEKLPFPKKICFTSFPTESEVGYFIPITKHMQGEYIGKVVNEIALRKYRGYDIFDMLK